MFDEEQWTMKREVQELIQQEKNKIENETMANQSQRKHDNMIDNSKKKLLDFVSEKAGNIERKILHYFQCVGCKDCSTTVKNRHLIASNEKEFKDDIKTLHRSLRKQVESAMDKCDVNVKVSGRINNLSAKMDDILKQKVEETIHSRKSENLPEVDAQELFEKLWPDATDDILGNGRHTAEEENIEATIQATILDILGPDCHLYRQKLCSQQSKRGRRKAHPVIFKVDPYMHMRLKRKFVLFLDFADVTDEDVNRLQIVSDKIIEQTRKYYDSTRYPDGKQFIHTYIQLQIYIAH